MRDFNALTVGATIGVGVMQIDDELLDQWQAVYGDRIAQRGIVPLGIVSAMVMRAYSTYVTDRPAGNIHVGQSLMIRRRPGLSELLHFEVRCGDKKFHKGRRIVRFDVNVTSGDGDGDIAKASNTFFWAS